MCQLKAAFSIEELKSARYTAGQLHRVGFTPRELKESGCYTARELANATGYPLFKLALLRDAGCIPDELKVIGYSDKQLQDVGYTTEQIGTNLIDSGEASSEDEDADADDTRKVPRNQIL